MSFSVGEGETFGILGPNGAGKTTAVECAEGLSRCELEVLDPIARGSTDREAAFRLFISEATVKTHLPHVHAKLGVNDRAAAVAAAYRRGLLPLANG